MEPNQLILKCAAIFLALHFFSFYPLLAQEGNENTTATEISGRVTGEDEVALTGVNVVIKGTSRGTITDLDGNYRLNANAGETIIFSYIGFETLEVTVGNEKSINITLRPNLEQLEEVVIVGYGTQKKVNMTSAVTSVDVKELGQITYPNIGAALQGRAPGLYIQDRGYQSGLSFLIRGQTTIGNNGPLVIVDGIPTSSFDINPLDIENISILKDGAAAAIYGARAAAGVILITTKSGAEQAPIITFDTHVGWGNVTTKPNILGSTISANIMNEAAINSGAEPLFTPEQINNFSNGTDPENYADTYWPDEVLKTEIQQKHYLSLSGGNAKTRYLFSLGYRNDNGIFKEAVNRTTYSTRLNLMTKIKENLDLSFNMFYTRHDNDSPSRNAGLDNIWQHTISIAPFMPIYRDGQYAHLNGAGTYGRGFWNPIWELNSGLRNDLSDILTGNVALNWEIVKGLTYTGRFAAATENVNSSWHLLSGPGSDGPPWIGASGQGKSSSRFQRLNAQNFLSFEKDFGGHNLSVLAGWDVEFTKFSFLDVGRRNYQFDFLLTELNAPNSGDNNDITGFSGNSSETALQSALGRLNYNYQGKYLLEFAARYDGSSNFAPETRYGLFPAVSLGWLISGEDFFNVSFFDYLKLRASWGRSGNNQVNGTYFSNIAFGNYYLGDGSTVVTTAGEGSVPFRELEWEKTTTANIGLEFSILDKALFGEIDVYSKTTDDILLASPVPGTVGTNREGPAINAGSVKNTGVELIISHRNKIGALNLDISLNGAYNKSEVLELTDAFSEFNSSIRVGDELGTLYGFISEGIIQTQAEADAYKGAVSGVADGTSPGDIKYKDINGDGRLDFEDVTPIATTLPKITYGFRLDLSWKNFDLQAFLQGTAGVDGYNNNDLFGNSSWIPAEAEDRWTPQNPDASYPRPLLFAQQTYFQNFYTASSFWSFDAAYLRLKNLQLGYNIPLPSNRIIKSARLYLAGTNIWTTSNYRDGFDPESPTSFNSFRIPPLKTYVVGLNVKF